MTLSQLQTLTRNLTLTDSSTYPDDNLNLALNRWYHRVTGIIIDISDEWNPQDNTVTINIVANTQSYNLSSGSFAILRVEINPQIYGFSGSWLKAYPLDLSEYSGGHDIVSIAKNFNPFEPYYSVRGGKIFLYPIPTVTVNGALKVWFSGKEVDLSQGTDEPNILEPFQKILALGAAYNYALANELPHREALKRDLNELIFEMKLFYGRRQKDRQLTMKPIYTSFK